ncbi:CheR family methyltransferase [Candidatus Methylospira mobilis]|nr:CheR family methyltransferase [Candidatus Methylospira mobilis]WNV04448.1 CheR family methyltransferase [Candidatus Methylospira mobilis]
MKYNQSIISPLDMSGPDGFEREFEFNARDFGEIKKLIYERAGISLSDSKQSLVYGRLGRRLRALAMSTFSEYLAYLLSHEDEWQSFINALTTNLTSFFREPHHFPILADHVKKLGRGKQISLWCSAASTGEEPYSMAMSMVELFDSYRPPVQIVATDIDTRVLETAQRGVYSIDRIEKMSPVQAKRFFLKGKGGNEGMVKVRQELIDMITFRQLNLLDNVWPVRGPLDAIFCRNVMIYFDKITQKKILDRFVPLMAPHALLFAGHSESFVQLTDAFSLRGKTVYELKSAEPKK